MNGQASNNQHSPDPDPRSKVAVFIGTRPEAVKMAPVIKAMEASDRLAPVVVSSGQHREMLDQICSIFDIGIDHQLDAMRPGQSLAALTARVVEQVDDVLADLKPSWSLVQGDTTTVMAASLASFYHDIPVGHVEAGLRTGNVRSPFPEEANRRLTSQITRLHFAPTERAARNLLDENVEEDRVHVTGNTVVDALLLEVARQRGDLELRSRTSSTLDDAVMEGWDDRPFVLITGHRRENLGDGLDNICAAIAQLSRRFPDHRFIYPVHLNPAVRGPVHRLLGDASNVVLAPPLDYRAFVMLMSRCDLVLTDSGGLQEEAPSLGKPVLIMRDNTERPEGLEAGTSRLVGTDVDHIVDQVSLVLTDRSVHASMAPGTNPFGDGGAAERIVKILGEHLHPDRP